MSSELYKSKGVHSREFRQSERRHALLEVQKSRRNELMDEHRCIEPLKKIFSKPHHAKRIALKNQIMLSEWLMELPDDIEKWYIKPCPKGTRVLVVAMDGKTKVYSKYGGFMWSFQSELPGRRNRNNSLTILDCIFVEATEEFYVLDVIAYGKQALTDCDAEFRFFWIESQIRDSGLDQVTEHNEYPLRIVEKYNCSDDMALNELFTKFPVWSNNQPELDGFLFYHSESSYVHGKTPLVGWLYPFMLPELFHLPYINENYMKDKPNDYSDYLTYIKEFDAQSKAKRKQRRRRSDRMDEEPVDRQNIESASNEHIEDENDLAHIVKDAMDLENEHNDADDDLHEFEIIDKNELMNV